MKELVTGKSNGRKRLYELGWFYLNYKNEMFRSSPTEGKEMFQLNITLLPSVDPVGTSGFLNVGESMVVGRRNHSFSDKARLNLQNDKLFMRAVNKHEWLRVRIQWPGKIMYEDEIVHEVHKGQPAYF